MKLVEDTQKQWSALGLLKQYAVLLVGAVALGLAIYAGVLYWQSSSLAAENTKLKQEAVQLQTKYDQDIGAARERELAAREDVLKADAKAEASQASDKQVAAIEQKIEQAEKDYEKAKADLGECPDIPTCLELLRRELAEANTGRRRN